MARYQKNHRLHPATVLALKALLLTGVHSRELRLAEWSDKIEILVTNSIIIMLNAQTKQEYKQWITKPE